jgi:hypothetical protein
MRVRARRGSDERHGRKEKGQDGGCTAFPSKRRASLSPETYYLLPLQQERVVGSACLTVSPLRITDWTDRSRTLCRLSSVR